jgi:hypothetical protein
MTRSMTAALLSVLAVLALTASPALAAPAHSISEVAASFTFQNGDETGRTWALQVDAAFGKTFAFGPVVRARYFSSDVNPDETDTGSLTLYELGGQMVIYTTDSHNGFSFGAEATYSGSDANGYGWAPFAQLLLGTDHYAFRGRVARPYWYGDEGNIDLGRFDATGAFVIRF